MESWKKQIFVKTIKLRMDNGENIKDILESYPKLTAAEKEILLREFE